MKKSIISIILLATILLGNNLDNGTEAYNNGNYLQAKKLFGKACDGGYIKGCYYLGLMYSNGDGIKQDRKQAKKLFGKACDGGDMGGCYDLGVMYANGEGIRQDKRQAKELFAKACDGGNMKACKGYKILNEAGI